MNQLTTSKSSTNVKKAFKLSSNDIEIALDATTEIQRKALENFSIIVNTAKDNFKDLTILRSIQLEFSAIRKQSDVLSFRVSNKKFNNSHAIEILLDDDILNSIRVKKSKNANYKLNYTELNHVLGVYFSAIAISQVNPKDRQNNNRQFSKIAKDALKSVGIELKTKVKVNGEWVTKTEIKVSKTLIPLAKKLEKELTMLATLPVSSDFKPYTPKEQKQKTSLFCSVSCDMSEIFKNGVPVPTQIIEGEQVFTNLNLVAQAFGTCGLCGSKFTTQINESLINESLEPIKQAEKILN